MKLSVILAILGCVVAAVADLLPENESEGREVTLIRRPRRYRFRVSFRRKYFPKESQALYPSNPFAVRKLGPRNTTTTTRTTSTEEYQTTVIGAEVRAEEESMVTGGFREEVTDVPVEARTDVPVEEFRTEPAPAIEALSDGWLRTSNTEFKFHPEGSTWDAAKVTCEGEGGFLAVLTNEGMKQDMLNFLRNTVLDLRATDGGTVSYLGYSGVNGDYRVTPINSPVSATGYSPWCGSSPANVTDLRCGALDTDCGGLIDLSCSLNLAFFCTRF